MKLALSLVFLFAFTFSLDVIAQGNFVSASNTIKSNKQSNQQLKVKSSKQAAKIVKARFGGKVLKVKKSKSGYRVKLIKTDGHIISVYVDAKSGKIQGKH
ncbi:MAG: PepSY domain-containing protein [Colwellia sp.]|nr:PepSY domain-containing protein [Colwellia sp.]